MPASGSHAARTKVIARSCCSSSIATARRLMSLCGRLSASSVDSRRNADRAATLDTATYSRSAVMCESVSTKPSAATGAAAGRGLDAASIRAVALCAGPHAGCSVNWRRGQPLTGHSGRRLHPRYLYRVPRAIHTRSSRTAHATRAARRCPGAVLPPTAAAAASARSSRCSVLPTPQVRRQMYDVICTMPK